MDKYDNAIGNGPGIWLDMVDQTKNYSYGSLMDLAGNGGEQTTRAF